MLIIKKSISLILPCYNPQEDWEKILIEHVKDLAESLKDAFALKIILVNDGSETNLERQIERISSQIPDFNYLKLQINKGKGFAV
ncbi:MAG: glycosyltransferase, partial [Melioribacteraceae bacterium]|nr:glycosyltransferase [Melioribacteraceae bacterium]